MQQRKKAEQIPFSLHFTLIYSFNSGEVVNGNQLVPVIKYLLQNSVMYKIRGFNDIISFENEECTCFGSPKHHQEQFLAKQNTQPASSTPSTLKNSNNEPPIKGSFKKSLKKQFVPSFLASKNTPTHLAEGHQQMKSPECTQKPREIREFLSPQNRFSAVNHKTYPVPADPLNAFYPIKTPTREIFNCKTIQSSSQQPISPFSSFPSQKTVSSPVLSPKPVKIQYNTTIAQKSHQPDRRAQQKRTYSPLSSKSINRQHYTVCSTIKPDMQEHHQRQIDRSESTRIIKMKLNEEIQKDEAYKSCVKFATLKSVISPSKNKNESIKSKIDTTQSGIGYLKAKTEAQKIVVETGRSKIQVKSLKDQKASLKKMDDVVEIYSQPDSQEHSDSDKQSIVLGRLNQYGSMIAPNSYNSTIQEKLTRFNSMTVDLSQEIKRIQQADRQFLTY